MLGYFVYRYWQRQADLQCLWEEVKQDGDGEHEDEEWVDGQLQDPVASRTQVQLIK